MFEFMNCRNHSSLNYIITIGSVPWKVDHNLSKEKIPRLLSSNKTTRKIQSMVYLKQRMLACQNGMRWVALKSTKSPVICLAEIAMTSAELTAPIVVNLVAQTHCKQVQN